MRIQQTKRQEPKISAGNENNTDTLARTTLTVLRMSLCTSPRMYIREGKSQGYCRDIPTKPIAVCSLHLWNPVFNARLAESGTQPLWTNLPDDGRAMSKTARSAASRICCASSMTIRRRNSLSPRNWNEGSAIFWIEAVELRSTGQPGAAVST
jgi:hypothetical protein